MQLRYQKIKNHANRLVISGYDITNRCNLRCKGCYFFEGDRSSSFSDDQTLEEFDALFASEVKRGVTMPHFAGAEPAKVPERLAIAAKHWNRGIIYTNGTLPIAEDLPFMLHISLWGVDETDARLRGRHAFRKGLENFAQDPRAIFIFTINHQNISEMVEATEICHQHGARISFNHYSPTRWYGKAGSDMPNEILLKGKGRFSKPDDDYALTLEDLDTIKSTISELLVRFPDTLIYSSYYNEIINSPTIQFALDPETGVATNCTILKTPHHRQYRTDLSWDDDDCCIPNTDCATCRHYVSNYSKVMGDFRHHTSDIASFEKWLEVYETWCRLNIRDWDQLS
ncbi:radical SAM protein [Amphritea sp.]|uniref:radical SAM protein n=1 Tax=Amphritea sp. TaxID=1872502 RepID=UPI003D0CE1BA